MPLPQATAYLWEWFKQLSQARGAGFSAAPISYSDLAAWAALRRVQLTTFETEVLLDLDRLYLTQAAKRR